MTFAIDRASTLWIDGTATTLPANGTPLNLGDAFVEQLSPTSYSVAYTTGETVTVTDAGSYLNVRTTLPLNAVPGTISGLTGSDSGNTANEFKLPNGTILQQPLSVADLYTTWANAWRVTQADADPGHANSLLDYATGETTATFTDTLFPTDSASIAALPANVVQNAENLIAAAGITDPAAAHDALQDYLLTGDPSFIQSASQEQASTTTVALTTAPAAGNSLAGVGVAALTPTVVEQASGATKIVFEVYRVGDDSTAQTFHVTAIAPGAGYVAAAGYVGNALPTQSVTLLAGQDTIDVTLDVNAIGATPQSIAEVKIDSGGNGTPVIAPTAGVIVLSAAPVEGTPAEPIFVPVTSIGTVTHAGSVVTLDLGTIAVNAALGPIMFDLVNQAAAASDMLSGTFSTSDVAGMLVSGLGPVTNIAAGNDVPLSLTVDTATAGERVSETIVFAAVDSNSSGFSGAIGNVTLDVVGQIACFTAGTRIAVPGRQAVVEHLRVGDPVLTHSGETRPVVWVGERRIDCTRHPRPHLVWPVRVGAGAFGPRLPSRDLLLSPDHAVFVDDVLVPVRLLINGTTIRQEVTERVHYVHVELDRHDIVLAEGLPAESYLDAGNRSSFSNGGDVVVAFPDFNSRVWEVEGAAPLIVAGPILAALRRRLAARADAVTQRRQRRARAG